ncbi:MarR family transcriptional regulator [Clostridium estertheticum]|uniref:MarR family winged helix-turn-helix transcriptional regulator n=1 Tax=Clostridium estertheticum TaxID=238834 RepID=UPI001CF5B10F|nr:MarR family transcriptional regulator [Clostridium estertheticum]MCB2309213.1 MarR family transcriptional regulator [Clostridium estertheticum]MCB2347576.1 MarR family transcriptional regulator [Clostridium estertheticum]MCB2352169.1 MarR family transcriptional regulator [Clostridium estertheticum]WAG48353.1 MarR family transcriptional regulator [Clostridium estertheticum]
MNKKEEFDDQIDIYYKFYFKINAIYHVWSRKHGIEDTVVFVLYEINENLPSCTQNEICEKLLLPKQTVSLILSGLEKKGYILRELNPKDRRNKLVRFTEQGDQYAKGILGELKVAEIEALSNMSQEERNSMFASFGLLSDLLAKSLSK